MCKFDAVFFFFLTKWQDFYLSDFTKAAPNFNHIMYHWYKLLSVRPFCQSVHYVLLLLSERGEGMEMGMGKVSNKHCLLTFLVIIIIIIICYYYHYFC